MVNNSTNINEAYTHLSSSDHDICRCKSRPWHGKDTTMWWGQRQYIYKQAIKNLHRFAPLKKTTYYHKNDNKMSLLTPQRTFLQQKVSIDTTKDVNVSIDTTKDVHVSIDTTKDVNVSIDTTKEQNVSIDTTKDLLTTKGLY